MLGAALLMLVGLAVAWSAMVLYTAWMLTHPPRRTTAWAVSKGRASNPGELSPPYGHARAFRSWNLTTPRGELPVWEMPGDDPQGPVVIVTHGWGESRVMSLMRAGPLARFASKLVVWDLPGHGEAPGICSLGVHEPTCLRALIEAVGEAGRGLTLVGSSLGAGVCIAACAEDPAIARRGRVRLVLEAPYQLPPTPARNVMRSRALPWGANLIPALGLVGLRLGAPRGWLRAGGPFDRARLAAGLTGVDVRVIVGDRDEICPPDEARAIAEACRGELRLIAGADHLNLWTEFLPATLEAVRDS